MADLIDRTDSPVKTEPPPVDDVPSHGSVDLTTDTDDEILKPEIIEPESAENEELEKHESDEICDTQSSGENDAENTDTKEIIQDGDMVEVETQECNAESLQDISETGEDKKEINENDNLENDVLSEAENAETVAPIEDSEITTETGNEPVGEIEEELEIGENENMESDSDAPEEVNDTNHWSIFLGRHKSSVTHH